MQRPWLLLLATVLVVALAVLATLQVRWINDLSAADEQRRRGALDFAARRLADDVTRECMRLHDALDQVPLEPAELQHRYEEWSASGREPKLLEAMYVAEPGPGGPELWRVDLRTGELAPVPWVDALDPVRSFARGGPEAQPPRRMPIVPQIP